jgi:hypothetical protein
MKSGLVPFLSIQEDDFRMENLRSDLNSLRERVAHLEASQGEQEALIAGLTAELGQVKSFLEDSNKPAEGIAGGFVRFRRDIAELKTWDPYPRLTSPPSASNPGLAVFLSRGSAVHIASFGKSISGEGAIGFLRLQSSKFEPRCILTQSSRDLYNFIDSDSTDYYRTSNSGSAWLRFEFREAIDVSGCPSRAFKFRAVLALFRVHLLLF